MALIPAPQSMGFGVVSRRADGTVSLLECGVIRTASGRPLHERIRDVYDGVTALIERHQPLVLSVEDVFVGKNVRSALTLGHARGAILLAASIAGIQIAEYSPVRHQEGRGWHRQGHQGSGRLHGAETPAIEGAALSA